MEGTTVTDTAVLAPTRPGACLWGAIFAAALACGGCTVDSAVARAGLPGTNFEARVENVKERGSFIDARVIAGGFDFRLFFPANDRCRDLLMAPAGLRFTWIGLMGRVSRGDERCDAVVRNQRRRKPKVEVAR